jgi:hypothetical protein
MPNGVDFIFLLNPSHGVTGVDLIKILITPLPFLKSPSLKPKKNSIKGLSFLSYKTFERMMENDAKLFNLLSLFFTNIHVLFCASPNAYKKQILS